MTMPKKGTRQIVVDGATYRYRIRIGPDEHCWGKLDRDRILIVETPKKKICQKVFETNSVTPKDIEHYIREEILNE